MHKKITGHLSCCVFFLSPKELRKLISCKSIESSKVTMGINYVYHLLLKQLISIVSQRKHSFNNRPFLLFYFLIKKTSTTFIIQYSRVNVALLVWMCSVIHHILMTYHLLSCYWNNKNINVCPARAGKSSSQEDKGEMAQNISGVLADACEKRLYILQRGHMVSLSFVH